MLSLFAENAALHFLLTDGHEGQGIEETIPWEHTGLTSSEDGKREREEKEKPYRLSFSLCAKTPPPLTASASAGWF